MIFDPFDPDPRASDDARNEELDAVEQYEAWLMKHDAPEVRADGCSWC